MKRNYLHRLIKHGAILWDEPWITPMLCRLQHPQDYLMSCKPATRTWRKYTSLWRWLRNEKVCFIDVNGLLTFLNFEISSVKLMQVTLSWIVQLFPFEFCLFSKFSYPSEMAPGKPFFKNHNFVNLCLFEDENTYWLNTLVRFKSTFHAPQIIPLFWLHRNIWKPSDWCSLDSTSWATKSC